MVREKSTSISRLCDIWIPIELDARACFAQFDKLKLDNRINIINKILRIMSLVKVHAYNVCKVLCNMDFMVVDTNGYDVLLRLDYLIKSGAVVDEEHNLI